MILNTIRSWPKWPPQFLVFVFMTASLLTLPISSTAKSICIGIAIATIVIAPMFWLDVWTTFSKLWCKSTLLFFFIVLLACLWSPASMEEKLFVLQKYSKLLYLPILVVGFQGRYTRNVALHAFLLAMLLTCVLSILQFYHFLHYNTIEPDRVFRDHIMTSSMMAFAAYISGSLYFRQRKALRMGYALLVVIFSFQVLFINGGRLGYIIYLLLMLLLMLQMLERRQILVGFFMVGTLFVLSFYLSPVMQQRTKLAISEWQHFGQNKDTPVGYRLQFHDYAKQLYWQHPLIGNGTGGFMYYFRVDKPIPSWDRHLLEPHSQYWSIAADFGLLGIFGFVLFVGSLLVASCRLNSYAPTALAVLLMFLVGNLTDSLLFYSGSGYFFILMMALCLGEESVSHRSLGIITYSRIKIK